MSKSYRELKERFLDFYSDDFFGTDNVSIFVNPTTREWKEILKDIDSMERDDSRSFFRGRNTPYGTANSAPIRGYVDDEGNLTVWHGLGATHERVQDDLGSYGEPVLFVSGTVNSSSHVKLYPRRNSLESERFLLDTFFDGDESDLIEDKVDDAARALEDILRRKCGGKILFDVSKDGIALGFG